MTKPDDVQLSKVVIGVPHKGYDACVQYDMGKPGMNGFERLGYPIKTSAISLQAVLNLRAEEFQKASQR